MAAQTRTRFAARGPEPSRRFRLSPLALALAAFYATNSPANSLAALHARSAAALARPPAPPTASGNPGGQSDASQSAALRTLRNRARVSAATELARQAQAAARAAAASSLVPEGLGTGGLDPVDNPLSFADDTTGLATWDGADLPTQQTTAGGAVEVSVHQTESRAILSWETFNVGQNTTVNFQQKDASGEAQPDWVALNRVVGQLDPTTGRRNPNLAPAPSQILGSIHADGTVLVVNQNGVIFGPKAQVNTHSLVASTLEVGRSRAGPGAVDPQAPTTLAQRNAQFKTFGLLGYADALPENAVAGGETFSAQSVAGTAYESTQEGTIEVQAGARISSAADGFLLLAGSSVDNAGQLSAPDGEIALVAGRNLTLTRAQGSGGAGNPDVRGLLFSTQSLLGDTAGSVRNAQNAIVEAPRGYIFLGTNNSGAVVNEGLLLSSTSVSRNGFIQIASPDIRLAPDSVVTIGPDDSAAQTIPQSPDSLADFRPSQVKLGGAASRIEIGSDAMVYAPGGDIVIGADPGPTVVTVPDPASSRILIDSGAIISAAGLTDVLIDASRNTIRIRPVKRNELRDSPDFREGFLNGATVVVDPRLSGVREDGVAWVGSPLIEAGSYFQQVGVGAAELMTSGGHINLGTSSVVAGTDPALSPGVNVRAGAELDIAGGWVRYEGGTVQTTRLITADGRVVDIGQADPNERYVGIYGGHTLMSARFGVTRMWTNPLLVGRRREDEFIEGRDAGSLTIKTPAAILDGTIFASAIIGPRQTVAAAPGSALSADFGDPRHLQGAPTQSPSGGSLLIQALGRDTQGAAVGGSDIELLGATAYAARPDEAHAATILLDADSLSGSGLAAVSLRTSGSVGLDASAQLELQAGGAFSALAGRRLVIDGSVLIASGDVRLQTADFGIGSVFNPAPAMPGDHDIVINGRLDVAGRWVNDFGASTQTLIGGAFLDGGSVGLIAAPRAAANTQTSDPGAPQTTPDLSGSILVGAAALVNVSSGGRVTESGQLDLSGRGGDLALISQTTYFQLVDDPLVVGGLSGFRISGGPNGAVVVNPDSIASRIVIDPASIRAQGFAGGGTFTLTTPAFALGIGEAAVGAQSPIEFFSASGFARFNITSYNTQLLPNAFANGLGGFNAVLATQTLSIGVGETLRLSQSLLPSILDPAQFAALQNLASFEDLFTVLTPGVPDSAFDRRGVELNLGGLLELHVAPGGRIEGEAGSALGVAGLFNEGYIRLPGGRITQQQLLLPIYGEGTSLGGVAAVHGLIEAFSFSADGSVDENAESRFALGISNRDLAANYAIYLLGDLEAGEGVRLAAGSVTDLSGSAILNPRATGSRSAGQTAIIDGRVVGGGSLQSLPELLTSTTLFSDAVGNSAYARARLDGLRVARSIELEPGAQLDLSGATATFDRLDASGHFVPTAIWSDAGQLVAGGGFTFTGAEIHADGGAPLAQGGALTLLDPVLSQLDPGVPTANLISAAMIEAAGFDTFVALGSVGTSGDVSLSLDRSFFLLTAPYSGASRATSLSDPATRDGLLPTVSATGNLEIAAPYLRFDSNFQGINDPSVIGTPGAFSVRFSGDTIDLRGAVLFDQSIGEVQLNASGDVRLIGAIPFEQTYGTNAQTPNSLIGTLVTAGDLGITAAQVYPTTGSTFSLVSTAPDGTIQFSRSSALPPDAPYSAGGDLSVRANNIIQGGVLRVPLGRLSLTAVESVRLTEGSITSVSANGLRIPYGITTDQLEWFFAPTGADPLTAPPGKELRIDGADVAIDAGATVDLSGGGDVYAYEFVPGTGGSRDVLDRFNADPFSGNDGLQYPDGRQVYAIVPGLSERPVAAFDPIYAADYADLGAPGGAGRRVYLDGVPGLVAGWYSLLPAQYALLPGGMRIVERSGTAGATAVSTRLADGSVVVCGRYGVSGSGATDSELRLFDVQTQDVIRKYSNIALTTGNQTFAARAARDGLAIPRLPIDAGRLVLNPSGSLRVDAELLTQAATGGRGAQADIGGQSIEILSSVPVDAPADGTVRLTATALSNLNASSLLIGGVRTDRADGSTIIDPSSGFIRVANDEASPLSAPEVILAVDGSGSGIAIEDGAAIVAIGRLDDARDGAFMIDGSRTVVTAQGAIVRVANGNERTVTRANPVADTTAASLQVGAAHLDGDAVLLESSGELSASAQAKITTDALAIGAGRISFADDATGLDGLVVTPELQALFAQAGRLSLGSASNIAFSDGDYRFGDLRLDTPGLQALSPGAASVSIAARNLELSNSHAAGAACDTECGAGTLSIHAAEIVAGPGALHTYGFGAAVTLSADKAIFSRGTGSIDVGSASLSLQTPYLGDRAESLAPSAKLVIPKLSLLAGGAVSITGPASGPIAAPTGTPGAVLHIEGQLIEVSGTRLHATAGTLELRSATGIIVANGAVIEAPGYERIFGDAADPTTQAAPGGGVSLRTDIGDIALGAGTLLSVGGGVGRAGTLELLAAQGSVAFGGALDASAPAGGGVFRLDSGAAFDLVGFGASSAVQGFTRGLDLRTRSGDLVLSEGQTLAADSLRLIADGGRVDIAGALNTSGINGGDVDLSGANGVRLESTARIDAHAEGYAADDSRSAHAGTVTLGTQGEGAIEVLSGAAIDLSAQRPGERLVRLSRNGQTFYQVAAADRGGVLHLRAPVIKGEVGDRVNVAFDGQVSGASEIVLEGFRTFDLGDSQWGIGIETAADGTHTAVLNSGTQGFLSDAGFAGGVVRFVQDFDVSASYAALGGLADAESFHARAGVDLAFDGDIRLDAAWNLGAGTVDVAGALANGSMEQIGDQLRVVAGRESDVFQNHTQLSYRSGGRVDGEAGILSLRASGTLDLAASISDGFFQFRDQTDPAYLVLATAGRAPFVPYSADGNSASPTIGLDPFASAELFPLLAGGAVADSWSFRLAGGADRDSSDPLRTVGDAGDVIVRGGHSYSSGSGRTVVAAYAHSLVRTGTGDIDVTAAGDVDLRNGENPTYLDLAGALDTVDNGFQVGGSAIYSAGHRADLSARTLVDPVTGVSVTLDPAAYLLAGSVFDGRLSWRYGADSFSLSGVLPADPVYATGGGDVSVEAGGDVLGRRDAWQEARYRANAAVLRNAPWSGPADQPWRSGAIGSDTSVGINPQLLQEGVATLGGGDIDVAAGGDVNDLSVIATASLLTADATSATGGATRALSTFGGGDIDLSAGGDLLGGRVDVASGTALLSAAGDVAAAGSLRVSLSAPIENTLRLRLSDAEVALEAGGEVAIQGVAALGVLTRDDDPEGNLNARGLYTAHSAFSILADGEVRVANSGAEVLTSSGAETSSTRSAIYPASFLATSLTGDLNLANPVSGPATGGTILYPSPIGQLRLFAAGDIAPLTLTMEDSDPGLLPGLFSMFEADGNGVVLAGRSFVFPYVLPDSTDVERRERHNADPTHLGDPEPVRIVAGGDIRGLSLSLPKPARVGAGRDIVDLLFFGQNLEDADVTRIVAGRDITATTRLVPGLTGIEEVEPGFFQRVFTEPRAALQGNSFVIGGPGSLILEAGRDAGPFLNSATIQRFDASGRGTPQTYGGGVLSVGNEYNPWLREQGADVVVLFGVGKGVAFDAFRDFYLDPANVAALDDDLFVQVDAPQGRIADRTQPIYGPILVAWMKSHASDELGAPYGRTEVSFEEAYAVFKALIPLRQRGFLIGGLFFNELQQTSVPDGPSFQQYSRGYRAVDTLFPGAFGYTQNGLEGGSNGANERVETGNLDLRLATLQTSRGGDIRVLGPGGRVLAGSVVRTEQQAGRRSYEGNRLYTAGVGGSVAEVAAEISEIPTGFEGLLTLRGGSIFSFTDGDLLLNQSRLFTQSGGDIALWSSNGDLNAGQGPKTSANLPPVVVRVDQDAFFQVDAQGGVSGAGIAALKPGPGEPDPDVFLIAPRGTVDAGDAGVRVAGNIFIAAASVSNSENFSVGGSSFGIPAGASVNVGAATSASATAAAAAQAATAAASSSGDAARPLSSITVEVLGFAGGPDEDEEKRKKR